jgi:HEAT repeat protein
MRCTRPGLLTALLAALVIGRPAPAAEAGAADKEVLKTAGLGTDGAALLEYFRARTLTEANRARIKDLIARLGHRFYKERNKASAELAALGPAALPWLREAMHSRNLEVYRRAMNLVKTMEDNADAAVAAAALRLLALRRPSGTAAVLLAFLPVAEEYGVASEVAETLAAIALDRGKPDPVLVAALPDPEPLRRAAAAEALCRAGAIGQVPAVRKLLADQVPAVRLRIARALVAANEEAAIPVLIGLLAELPLEQAQQAEEVLERLAGVLAPNFRVTADSAWRRQCRDAWAAWWKDMGARTLVDYFRKRTLADTRRTQILELVRQLGHPSYKVRQKAAARLVALKSLAVPFLKEALASADPEVRARAERCLKQIEAAPDVDRTAVYVRLLALRRPAEAAGVLLAYVPFAEDASVVDEVRDTMARLARTGDPARQTLRAALREPDRLRRLTAAEALCQARLADALPAVGKLLQDPEPGVRLRAALALAGCGDRKAVAVLIDLLAEVPPDLAGQAEEFLRRLADQQAPAVALGSDPAGRRKCRDAWREWWRKHADNVDLAGLAGGPRLLGYTLVAQWDYRGQVNDLIELGPDHKPRWRITGLRYSFDFEVLPGNRLLVPEHLGHRVTERDFTGKVLWEYQVQSPVNCQRLANGNTFIATPSEVVEVTRARKEVYRIKKAGIMAGARFPNGQIVIVTSDGQCTRMDTAGKELKRFAMGGMNNYGGIELLPGGRILISSFSQNKVVEYDSDGKVVWKHEIRSPGFSTRLPNRNTLITSQDGRYAVEVTRAGKEVWAYRPGQAIWRVRRR